MYTPPKVKSKYFPKYFDELGSLNGKTIAITGTTSGTGFVAARAAFQKGARVFVLNRASPRVETSLTRMREELVSESVKKEDFGEVEAIDCDLQDFSSVRAAAAKLNEKCSETGLDALCNNAGVMALEDIATKDGFDIQMQTNHLSHFLLTKLVFPSLEKAAEAKGQARIVNHSSMARLNPKAPLKSEYLGKNGGDLGGNSSSLLCGGARWQRYHQTKLANSVFTLALKSKLEDSGSKIIALCGEPGVAATELQSTTAKQGGMGHTLTKWFMKLAQSQEDGALGILKCMFDTNVKSGELWGPGGFGGDPKPIDHGKLSSKEAEVLLWKESEVAIGEEFKI